MNSLSGDGREEEFYNTLDHSKDRRVKRSIPVQSIGFALVITDSFKLERMLTDYASKPAASRILSGLRIRAKPRDRSCPHRFHRYSTPLCRVFFST